MKKERLNRIGSRTRGIALFDQGYSFMNACQFNERKGRWTQRRRKVKYSQWRPLDGNVHRKVLVDQEIR